MSIQFGTLYPDGTYIEGKKLDREVIKQCKFYIIDPDHYRDDGSCKCDDPAEQQRMIDEWEYTPEDFQ